MKLHGRLFVWAVAGALTGAALSSHAVTRHYLFVGHTRADGPGQIVQRKVERIDFSRYDLIMLGGDYAPSGTTDRRTVAYLDAVLSLRSTNVLATLGNHDTAHRNYFTDVTGRPLYYAFKTNNIAFIVLDTSTSRNVTGGELQLVEDTVNSLTSETHLILIHHHIIWLADYQPLAYLIGDARIASSSATLSGLNFYDDVYPLLLQAHSNGVEVICAAGDRTGSDTEEFYIDHTTAEGIHFLAAGLKEDLVPELRTVIEWEHDTDTGELTWNFVHLTDLPFIPDEPVVISELHYNPATPPGNDYAFVELLNHGDTPYDLSGAWFSTGIDCTFPSNTVLAPGERVLVAADATHYTNLGVRVFDYAGNTKPDAANPMWLRDSRDLEIDYVAYGTSSPWPSEPDNNGPSLVLIDPASDNSLPENWTVSDYDGGTPGAYNFQLPEGEGKVTAGTGGVVTAWQNAVAGRAYQLEGTARLLPPNWTPVGPVVTAGTVQITVTDTNTAGSGSRFYRLRRVFP